jgi:uracil-DNA glycosylase
MTDLGNFPFGRAVHEVVQTDRTPKRVFILGVYASAVHARWLGPDGKTIVTALAVASEPHIFWRGEDPELIIQQISIPEEVGRLVPASDNLNGPSGITLDEKIISPLGLKRTDTWLCDLVPHSCVNSAQAKAIKAKYTPLIGKYNLPMPTVPEVPKQLANDERREAILNEIKESGADTLILLGDQPIKWFLSHYDKSWKKLSDFSHYGRLHETQLQVNGKSIKVLPLAHPRQIAKLGLSSPKWFEAHKTWMESADKVME